MGTYGCPVVTAITVQQAGAVKSRMSVSPDLIRRQLQSICDDGPVTAIKTGMLCNSATVDVIRSFIRDELKSIPLIVDPVLKAGSGDSLSDSNLLDYIRKYLIPMATLVTPNIDEAELLANVTIDNIDDMKKAGQLICDMGAKAVIIKGGHLQTGENTAVDVLVSKDKVTQFSHKWVDVDNVHGTGCTFASACTALLSTGYSIDDTVSLAGKFTQRVISNSFARKSGLLPGHFPLTARSNGKEDSTSFYLPPAFCSKCGARLNRKKDVGEHLFCSNCGFIHYRNPLPAVVLLVHDNDNILITRRLFAPHKGELCFPGGFLEIAETYKECGERELLEETGLTISKSSIFDVRTDTTAYGGILLIALEVSSWTGILQAGDDAEEVMWMPINEAPALAFNAHNVLLEKLRAKQG